MRCVSDSWSLIVDSGARATLQLDDRRFTEYGTLEPPSKSHRQQVPGANHPLVRCHAYQKKPELGMYWASAVHIDCSGVLGIRYLLMHLKGVREIRCVGFVAINRRHTQWPVMQNIMIVVKRYRRQIPSAYRKQEYQKKAELGSRRPTVIAVLSCQVDDLAEHEKHEDTTGSASDPLPTDVRRRRPLRCRRSLGSK